MAVASLPGGRLLALGGLVGGSSSDWILAGRPGSLRRVGRLPTPTHDAAAALLGSSVYLFGGGEQVSSPAVVRVDPATGRAARRRKPRRAALRSRRRSGRSVAYLVGGYTGSRFATAILRYRPGTAPALVARLPTGLRYAGVAMLGGRIYVAGGVTTSGESSAVYAVDPHSRAVTQVATLPAPVAHAPLVALGRFLYLVGGTDVHGNALTSILRVDPAQRDSRPSRHAAHSARRPRRHARRKPHRRPRRRRCRAVERGALAEVASLRMTERVDVAVVGGGVAGLATAWALRRAGREPVVLEQFRVGHTQGSSHGATRIFRLAYAEEEWVRLAQEALVLWRELEQETGEPVLDLVGLLDLADDPAPLAATLDACGTAYELLSADEAGVRFGLETRCSEVLFQPEAGVVLADRALRGFAAGVDVREETRVTSLDPLPGGGVRVRTERGSLDANEAVVAGGAWARQLVADLPVVVTRETVAYFRLADDRTVPSVIDYAADETYALTAGPGHAQGRTPPLRPFGRPRRGRLAGRIRRRPRG